MKSVFRTGWQDDQDLQDCGFWILDFGIRNSEFLRSDGLNSQREGGDSETDDSASLLASESGSETPAWLPKLSPELCG